MSESIKSFSDTSQVERENSHATGAACLPVQPTTRADVLALCEQESLAWDKNPGRNLVLMFDGTGNILGNQRDTNVVRLMRVIDKVKTNADGKRSQLVYYDPGVGTSNQFHGSTPAAVLRQKIEKIGGLALGSGAFEDIAQAYEFLVRYYQDGDRIFLFGFSRGAFTARALGGMLNTYGLVQPMALPMLPLMVNNYFAKPEINGVHCRKDPFYDDIITNFALTRRPLVHFVGVWDTVETIGSGLTGGVKITNPPSIEDKRFVHVRHALAIHETRDKYRPRMYEDPAFDEGERVHRTFEQRWFAGVHSDIGGSYPRDGLSVVSLQWMADAARSCGLQLTETQFTARDPDRTMHDETFESPFWAWTGLSSRPRANPSDLDPNSVPVERALPADTIARKTLGFSIAGWALLAIVLLLAAASLYFDSVMCTVPSHSVEIGATVLQFLAPWQAQFSSACSLAKLGVATRWDLLLVVAYCLWLPFPVSWSIRRLARPAIDAGRSFPAWLTRLKWAMLALFLAAVAEHVLVALLARHAGVDASDRLAAASLNMVQHWFDHAFRAETFASTAVLFRTAFLGLAMASTLVKFGATITLATAIAKGAATLKK